MSLGNRADTRFLYWAIALTLIVVVAVTSITVALNRFKSSSHDAEVRTGFSELIGHRLAAARETSGIFSVPVDAMEWGGGQIADGFAEAINELPPGDYRYTVYLEDEDLRFIVFNDVPELVSSGLVPDELTTE